MARKYLLFLLAPVLGYDRRSDDVQPYSGGIWGGGRKGHVAWDERGYEEAPIATEGAEGWEGMADSPQGAHREYDRMTVRGNIGEDRRNGIAFLVKDPFETFSVLPPKEGCGNGGFTPSESANGRCLVTTNAGYFNTSTFACHGTTVSDGEVVNEGDEINVSFGITEEGKIIVGYLTESQKREMGFRQLVNGVVWLVRNGTNYIDKSIQQEALDTQETGCTSPNDCFFRKVKAARMALGHDAAGRIIMLAMDGWSGFNTHTWHPRLGQSLDEMADMLISLGAVNAINLDGGGSLAVFEKGVQVNSPTDMCGKELGGYNISSGLPQACVRKVTSILCVHEPDYADTSCPSGGPQLAYILITLSIIGGINVLFFAARFRGATRNSASSPACQAGSKLPTYKRSPLAIKKLRKKRGAKHTVLVDLELTALPATGYDEDSNTEGNQILEETGEWQGTESPSLV